MMLGIELNLSYDDKSFVMQALDELIPTLRQGEKPVFNLVKSKLVNEKPLIDGMYLRCIEQALMNNQKHTNNHVIFERCNILIQFITKERLNFQYSSMSRLKLAGA
jgi:hypothetical protein